MAQHAAWLGTRSGARTLVLAVDAANVPAVKMYERAGFVVWDRRRALCGILPTGGRKAQCAFVSAARRAGGTTLRRMSMRFFCSQRRASVSAELNVTCDREKIRARAQVCPSTVFPRARIALKIFFAASMSR